MAKRRKRRRVFSRQISQGYHLLSALNTLSWLLSGDLGGIFKHFMRKRAHRKLGGWLR